MGESSLVVDYKDITSSKEEQENIPELQKTNFKNSRKKNTTSNSNHDKNIFLPALEILSRVFGLGEFEKNMVLLCAAVELDSETFKLCSLINKNISNLNSRL